MRSGLVIGVAVASLALAHVARDAAEDETTPESVAAAPFAPAPSTAPFVSLGYREATADLMWVRLTGYFGGDRATSDGVASLVEAIVALDPRFRRVYEWGARAMTMAHYGVGQASYQRAIETLRLGGEQFPDDYRLPMFAGETYIEDLVADPKDTAQRAKWDEQGALLLESASRKPNAPPDLANVVAFLLSKLGQHEHAVTELREAILLTDDEAARARLIDQLGKLVGQDAEALRGELVEQRRLFDDAWKRDRPEVPPTMFVLVGPHLGDSFSLEDLAAGGKDLAGSAPIERLEPIDYSQ